MATNYNWRWPVTKSTATTAPIQYNRNGSATTVSQDTATPANSRPLPVTALNTSGVAIDPSTAQNQATANTYLSSIQTSNSSIDGKLTTTANGLKVDGSGSTQPVSGTVTANQGTAGAAAWKVDGSGVTQPISAASLPLPTGAATSAKQPALGTAGTASSDVLSVQGIAGMTALKVDGSGITQPISGTVNQGTGGASAWKVDGSAVTQPVSAASLPLPAGAATSAKQPALGTAGTASTDVITVQGITNGTPQNIASTQLPASLGAKTTAASLSVTLPTDAAALSTKSPVNVTATYAEITNLTTTAQTFTAPSNAVGFLLEYPSIAANTDNIRWKIGSAPTVSSGMRMEPGRDTGFIPSGLSVQVIAETATAQTVTIQWVTQ